MTKIANQSKSYLLRYVLLLILLFVGGFAAPCAFAQPGTVFSSSASWGSGSVIGFLIDDARGREGVNWSLNDIFGTPGTLDITADEFDPVVISLESLFPGSDQPGAIANWNNQENSSWRFVKTTGGISGFTGKNMTVDSSLFALDNDLDGGKFGLRLSGNDLYVDFISSVNMPEPPSASLTIPLFAIALIVYKRRKR